MRAKLEFAGNGVGIDGGLLWVDAPEPKPLCAVTHAHGDHVARHRKVICTRATAEMMRLRTGGNSEYRALDYGQSIAVGDLKVTLRSAGHVLGSAMVHVEGPRGSLLVTGDVRLDGGLTCPPAEPVHVDTLVMESTFGRPDHRLPPAEEVRAEVVEFARETIEAGATPVFLAYAFGKAQELMALLCGAGLPVACHGTVWNLVRVYRTFGQSFPGSRKLSRGAGARRAAIIVPPRFLNTPEVQAAHPLKVAAISGWGNRTLRPGIDRSFPLSDHGDFDDLLALVERVQPKRIYTIHGYATEFAEELRSRGYDAVAVDGHSGPADGKRPGMFA
ncbi:MAG: MBL fold metallo-hydrolase [Planctomycetota bacterium]|jgi:Cft2 family RNA processing exonuclease